jgi:hypothetical protein
MQEDALLQVNAVNGTRDPPARLVNGCTYNLYLPENTEVGC